MCARLSPGCSRRAASAHARRQPRSPEREATPRACARVPIRRAAGRWLRAWERRGLRHRGCPGGRLSKPPLWAHLRRQPRRSGIVPAIFPSSGSRLRDTASHRGNPSRPRSFPGLGIPERPARGRRVLRGPVLLTGPASLGLRCSSPPPGVPAAALPPAAGSASGAGRGLGHRASRLRGALAPRSPRGRSRLELRYRASAPRGSPPLTAGAELRPEAAAPAGRPRARGRSADGGGHRGEAKEGGHRGERPGGGRSALVLALPRPKRDALEAGVWGWVSSGTPRRRADQITEFW